MVLMFDMKRVAKTVVKTAINSKGITTRINGKGK